ncbi:hypothetical protein [Burkholderia vietnamiensis]|uniref:hypothetical protein n=1 Tax=Burkholderia vietnamiensis TaxID=60552 RepID=UPI001593DC03|nr:hypothetical protein [Burkholderia vietnamiensis]
MQDDDRVCIEQCDELYGATLRWLLFKDKRYKDHNKGYHEHWTRRENFREFYKEQKRSLAPVTYADPEKRVLRIARMFLWLQMLAGLLPNPTGSAEEEKSNRRVKNLIDDALKVNREDVLAGFRQHYPDLLDDMLGNNAPKANPLAKLFGGA